VRISRACREGAITLALGQLIYFFFLQAPFINGEEGLQSIPRPDILGILPITSDVVMYYVVFITVTLSLSAI